jgi:hypothetical protein
MRLQTTLDDYLIRLEAAKTLGIATALGSATRPDEPAMSSVAALL